jgi:hypothetical protein
VTARFLLTVGCISFLCLFAGCSGPPGMQKVTGKVTYDDGSIPTGEFAMVRFESVAGTHAEGQSKGASGKIGPDGTYTLTTIENNDGAYVGEYKVCFTVLKGYPKGISMVEKKFTEAQTTPHTAKVVKGGPNKFDFTISKAPGT